MILGLVVPGDLTNSSPVMVPVPKRQPLPVAVPLKVASCSVLALSPNVVVPVTVHCAPYEMVNVPLRAPVIIIRRAWLRYHMIIMAGPKRRVLHSSQLPGVT